MRTVIITVSVKKDSVSILVKTKTHVEPTLFALLPIIRYSVIVRMVLEVNQMWNVSKWNANLIQNVI